MAQIMPDACRVGVRPGWAAVEARAYPGAMSERTKNMPRRSCHATPGSNEKMLGKAPGLGADQVFLDLEDSVSPLEKEAAREKVVHAIKNQDWGDTVVCVRVNAWDTEWTYRDVITVVENAGDRLDEIMLPKVQNAADVEPSTCSSPRSKRSPVVPAGSESRRRSKRHGA